MAGVDYVSAPATAPDMVIGMDFGLRGKTALVCASTAGLGRGAAEALAAEGARVVITGRHLDVAREIAETLPGSEAVALDVTHDGAAEKLAAEAVTALEAPIDIVVLNGPGPKPGAASEISSQDAAEAIRTLLLFQQELVAATLPRMLENGWGRIVAVGSSSIIEPIPGLALSSTGRAALAAYLKTLAGEVAAQGVTVNMVLPGRIDTDRVRELDNLACGHDPDAPAKTKAAIPAGRYGTIEEFGALVAFLCSEQAGYITGTAPRVDGGAARQL